MHPLFQDLHLLVFRLYSLWVLLYLLISTSIESLIHNSILHGVPLLIKDSIVTMEMEATAGSIALLGSKPSQEASIITRLRAAGAIILGKANMSEWSGCRAGNASGKGWSPRGGQCTSPYHPNMLAAGSSTGSAVSTALGLTFAALGTEVLDYARSLDISSYKT